MAQRLLLADHLLPPRWETKDGEAQHEPLKKRLQQSPPLTPVEITESVPSADPGDATPATLAPQAGTTQQPKVVQTAFIQKLYTMVEDESNNHLISWSTTNDGFVMSPSTEFSKVLAIYFKHTNISSFVRQLNMYGFHKVNDVFNAGKPDPQALPMWEFKHGNGNFSRGDLLGLRDIKRRASRHALIHRDFYNAGPSPLRPYTMNPRTIDGHDLNSYDRQRSSTDPSSVRAPRRSEREIEAEIAMLQEEKRQLRRLAEDYSPPLAFSHSRLPSRDGLSYAKSISGSTLYDEREIEQRGLEAWIEQVQDMTKSESKVETENLEDMSLDSVHDALVKGMTAEVQLDAPVGFVPKLIQVLGPPAINDHLEIGRYRFEGARNVHTERATSTTSAKFAMAQADGLHAMEQDAKIDASKSTVEQIPSATANNSSVESASTRASETEVRSNILKSETNTTISSMAAMSLDDASSTDEASTQMASNKTAKDIMVESLVQILRKWLAAQFHRQRQTPEQVTGSETKPSSNATGGEGGQNSSTSQTSNGKRRQKCPEDDEDQSGRGSKRRALDSGQDDQVNQRRLFACPFYKRRPAHYQGQEWKTCREPPLSWHQVHRVKEHLLTHHMIKQQCGRCGQAFATVAALTAHQRLEVPCCIQPLRQLEGINAETAAKLSSRKGIRDLSEHDKWYHWYKILFQQEIEDEIGVFPVTPYHDKSPSNIGPLEDFIRHEFVAEVQRELEAVIPTQVTALMPQMTSVLRTAMHTVMDRFYRAQNIVSSTDESPSLPSEDSTIRQRSDPRDLVFEFEAQLPPPLIDHSQDSVNLDLGQQHWQDAFSAQTFDPNLLDGWSWAPPVLPNI